MGLRLKKWNYILGGLFHSLISALVLFLVGYFALRSVPSWIEQEEFSRDTVAAHLTGLSNSIRNEAAAERMQSVFPEGACFTLTLYGLAWGNALPHLSENERGRGFEELRYVLDRQTDSVVTQPFVDTQVRNGVFWLGQRNLVLGKYLEALDRGDRPQEMVDEYHRNSQELADAFLASPTHHLDSYPGMCWPADNVTALRSIVLHDELYGTEYRDAYEEWKAWTEAHPDPLTGMPAGHLKSTDGTHIESARGCANSWIIPLINEMDPEYATELYGLYKESFIIKRLGYEMLREWPHGTEGHGADVDSGPIVWGAGITATGVGLATARSQGDMKLEADIRDLSRVLGFPDHDTIEGQESVGYLFGILPVGDAFLSWGYTVERADPSPAGPLMWSRIVARWPWFLVLFLAGGLILLQWFLLMGLSRKRYRKITEKNVKLEANEK